MRFRVYNFLLLLVIACLSAIYVDFLAFNLKISLIVNGIFIFIFLYLLINNYTKSVKLLIFYFLLIPEYSRSILDDYDLIVQDDIKYSTLYSFGLGPINGLLILFLIWIFFGLFFRKKMILSKNVLISCFTFVLIYLFSFIYNYHSYRFDLSNNAFYLVKPFVFFLVGSIIGNFLKTECLFEIGLNSSLILGIRTIFFLMFDLIMSEIPKLDLGLVPYFSFGILLYIYLNKIEIKKIYLVFIIFSIFSPSRSFIAMAFTMFALFSVYKNGFFKTFKNSMLVLIFILPIFGFTLFYLNERLFMFFLWKLEVLNFFIGGNYESGSGSVRMLELTNIIYEISNNMFTILFGKGPLGTYTFEYAPLIVDGVIDGKSFSEDQLMSGRYYTVHNVVSAFLLKSGILGFLCYVSLYINILFQKNLFKNILLLPLFYTSYSTFSNSFITGYISNEK